MIQKFNKCIEFMNGKMQMRKAKKTCLNLALLIATYTEDKAHIVFQRVIQARENRQVIERVRLTSSRNSKSMKLVPA